MASNPIKGSCLCGGVRFELDRAAGPFEICHCNRCRKVSGSVSTRVPTFTTTIFDVAAISWRTASSMASIERAKESES
jgi:hypothetical protein